MNEGYANWGSPQPLAVCLDMDAAGLCWRALECIDIDGMKEGIPVSKAQPAGDEPCGEG